ncbi:MAG: cbb3-type cytochrome c oxidase N-terminal domain-containing protein [Bacteroidota bacterium]
MNKLKYLLILLSSIAPGITFGQDATKSSFLEMYQVEIILALAVLVCLVALVAMYVLLVAMKTILKSSQVEKGVAVRDEGQLETAGGGTSVDFWKKFWNRVNDSVPVAREAEIVTNHEYDGIRELDNRLPPWWLYGFYATIVFSAIYLFRFYFLDMPSQQEEFQAEMTRAKEEVQVYLASLDNLIDESNVSLLEAEMDLNAGKAIFEQNCAVCHMADGGGGVGPNLTDQYWLHGGDMPAIFSTIKYGVLSKGMISWESQLSPKKMQQVSSYIYMMEGTTPANPKEPQGDLFIRDDEAKVDSDTGEEPEEVGGVISQSKGTQPTNDK